MKFKILFILIMTLDCFCLKMKNYQINNENLHSFNGVSEKLASRLPTNEISAYEPKKMVNQKILLLDLNKELIQKQAAEKIEIIWENEIVRCDLIQTPLVCSYIKFCIWDRVIQYCLNRKIDN